MDPREQSTGTRDEHYNLISVLYHALHGAENCEAYTIDAEASGDEQLAMFFQEAQAMQTEMAERAKELLGILEVPPEPEVAPDAPVEGGISPGAMSGGIPPQPTDVPPDTLGTSPSDVAPRDVSPGDPSAELAEDVGDNAAPDVPPPHIPVASPPEEASGEPGRATPDQQADKQPEEEKGLIDKAKDRLTGREDPDRPRG